MAEDFTDEFANAGLNDVRRSRRLCKVVRSSNLYKDQGRTGGRGNGGYRFLTGVWGLESDPMRGDFQSRMGLFLLPPAETPHRSYNLLQSAGIPTARSIIHFAFLAFFCG